MADDLLKQMDAALDDDPAWPSVRPKIVEILAARERSEPADFDRQIAGGLRDAINAHGSITPPFIASATKRVAHAIRDELKRERDRIMNSTPRQL